MNNSNLKRVSEYFTEFSHSRSEQQQRITGKLHFCDVDGQDVYNTTAPFFSANKTIIAGRVEPRDQEHSVVMFFEQKEGLWHPIPEAPIFTLQDPFISFVQGDLVFGGVEIREIEGGLEWKTIFYRGADIFNLVKFFSGPAGMKDIRLCDRKNGRIAVFTRPQGTIGGLGSIAYTEVASLAELTLDVINAAKLLENMLHPLDWGGVNETHLLENGDIGLLAHISCFEQDDRSLGLHYYAASFIFDPVLRKFRDLKIIASRDQFSQGPAKRPELADVIFASGLTHANHVTSLFAGVSDTEAHWLEIDALFMPNP